MPVLKSDCISKGDTIKVLGGTAFAGQSGIAMEDNFGRHGMVSVQFEGYPNPRRIDANRLKVTRHDPNSPQVVSRHVPPTYIGPVGKPPLGKVPAHINEVRKIIRGIKTSKDKAIATRQTLVQSFPTQEDRDQEEALIHTRAHRFTELRRARLTVAYWK